VPNQGGKKEREIDLFELFGLKKKEGGEGPDLNGNHNELGGEKKRGKKKPELVRTRRKRNKVKAHETFNRPSGWKMNRIQGNAGASLSN